MRKYSLGLKHIKKGNTEEMKKEKEKTFRKLEHWEIVTLLLIAYDFCAVLVSYLSALWIQFECNFNKIDPVFMETYYHTIGVYAVFCVAVFWFLRLYKSIWRFASYTELIRVILGTGITGICHIVFVNIMVQRMPVSYYIFGIILQFVLTLGVRFAYRFILLLRGRREEPAASEKKVMLIGAGNAGQLILRDIKNSKETNERVCCFIDDNHNKWGRYIDNIPVFGGRDCIMEAAAKFEIDKIYVALPSAQPEDKREILRICNETSCDFVLDMGEPVKIDTLARNLIRLSGYKPDIDMKVVYSGLRDIIGTTKKNLCFSMV